jgi:sugar fermentation stimulation protein A
MDIGPDLVEGVFIERLNRFAALVDINGKQEMIHVANSGRMRELFVPGYRVLLKYRPGGHRKTKYDLALVDIGAGLASADARLPNALVREALDAGRLPQFAAYPQVRPESTFGESRLDFLLEGPEGKYYVETKSVTLVVDGVGLFPDAPTSRGVKHLKSLEQALAEGHRAAAIFVIQRGDAQSFSTSDDSDPEFAVALRHAMAAGVETFAYKCRVTERLVELAEQLPIRLAPLSGSDDLDSPNAPKDPPQAADARG